MFNGLAGNGTEGIFTVFDLYAGESDIITTNETVAQGLLIAQYTVMSKQQDGFLVPFTLTADGVQASGTLTFGAQPAPADTVTINGVAVAFVAANPVGSQVLIGASAAATAANLVAYINANEVTFAARAVLNGSVITVEAVAGGTGGNAIGLAKSGANPTVSGATLAGGANEVETNDAFCITAQAVDATLAPTQTPVFTGGVFNHAVLVWPAACNTELLRRQAFDGSPISVRSLK